MAREFKTWNKPDRTLRVAGGPDRTSFSIRNSQNVEALVFVENDTMPEVVLGIMEESGLTETDSPYIQEAADNLRAYIHIEGKVAAEAEAQAKLEAEALELMNVRLRASGTMTHLTKETVDPMALEGWLAVARRARELNKEEK